MRFGNLTLYEKPSSLTITAQKSLYTARRTNNRVKQLPISRLESSAVQMHKRRINFKSHFENRWTVGWKCHLSFKLDCVREVDQQKEIDSRTHTGGLTGRNFLTACTLYIVEAQQRSVLG